MPKSMYIRKINGRHEMQSDMDRGPNDRTAMPSDASLISEELLDLLVDVLRLPLPALLARIGVEDKRQKDRPGPDRGRSARLTI